MVQKLYLTPFAKNGTRLAIPNELQVSGDVSYDQGFGPDYDRQLGVDPLAKNIQRSNYNASIYDITVSLQELQSGVAVPAFDPQLAAALAGGGYPQYSAIPSSNGMGFWLSTISANTINPNVAGSKWLPLSFQGSSAFAFTNANVAATNLQAASPLLILTGVLTADVSLILPSWIYQWSINNKTTGDFTVTIKTLNTAGVVAQQGTMSIVVCEGLDMFVAAGDGVTRKMLQQMSPSVAVAGGTANAIVVDYQPKITALTDGMTLYVRAVSRNTGASTLSVGTTGAKAIYKRDNIQLADGDIAGAGQWLEFQFDTSLDKWCLMNPAVIAGSGAVGGGDNLAFYENSPLISEDYTIGQAAQKSCTVSIATSVVVTMPNDFVAEQPVFLMTTGALPTGLVPLRTYFVVAGVTAAAFNLSATPGGVIITTTGTQSGNHTAGPVNNAGSFGPMTIKVGADVTVPIGAEWSIV